MTGSTTTFNFNLPVVGGDTNTWGDLVNANWTALDALLDRLFPPGGIIMWSGPAPDIPDGWVICDGTNGTPDLRDRFVVGAGTSYSVQDTGGEDSVALTTSQLPTHSHSFSGGTTNSAGDHFHRPQTGLQFIEFGGPGAVESGWTNGSTFNPTDATSTTDTAGAHTHTVTGTVGDAGSGNTHENRPPYYAVYYIMKT